MITNVELAGFIISNPERELLTCRYTEGDLQLYEVPTVPLRDGTEVGRSCVQDLTEAMQLQVTLREKLSRTVIRDLGGIDYGCTWLLADVHNGESLWHNNQDSQWHYVTVPALRSGHCVPGPHTSKLLWAILNQEIRLR